MDPPPRNCSWLYWNSTDTKSEIYTGSTDGPPPFESIWTNQNSHSRIWAKHLKPDTSYFVATGYIAILSAAALFILAFRSRTRLRLIASYCTFLALSVAVLGLLRAKTIVYANWFWMWNFIAEGVGVVALTCTIVNVGNGFYPMAGKRNIYWRMAMGITLLYAIVATANIILYIHEKIIFREITGEMVAVLRADILKTGIMSEQSLRYHLWKHQCMGLIPSGDLTVLGVENWTDLSRFEKDMYARPEFWAYVVHQMLMFVSWGWASVFLFIPLVRNHRNGPIGRPVDSDMMAVGIWYLTCLMTLTTSYVILNIYYCFKKEMIFEQQTQALDLCIRATIAPILFLPTPSIIIRFCHDHFKTIPRMPESNSGGATPGYGPLGRNGSGGGDGRMTRFNGSFTNTDNHNVNMSAQAQTLEVFQTERSGSTKDSTRGSLETVSRRASSNIDAFKASSGNSSPARFKLFNAKNRGTSSDSNRVLNEEYAMDRPQHSHYSMEERRQSGDRMNALLRSSLQGGCGSNAGVRSTIQEDNTASRHSPAVETSEVLAYPQEPQLAHTTDRRPRRHLYQQRSTEPFVTMDDSDSVEEITARQASPSAIHLPHSRLSDSSEISDEPSDLSTRHGHRRQVTDGENENSLSHPLEQPYPTLLQYGSPDAYSISGTTKSLRNNQGEYDPSLQGLTGLQRQLAEYKSALFPVVMAMHQQEASEIMTDPSNSTSLNRNSATLNLGPAQVDMGEPELGPETKKRPTGLSDPLTWTLPPQQPLDNDFTYDIRSSTPNTTRSDEALGQGFMKKWFPAKKPAERSDLSDEPHFPKKLDGELTLRSVKSGDLKTNRGTILSTPENGAPPRNQRPKESRLAAFTKALAGNGPRNNDRGRYSQDVGELDKDNKLPLQSPTHPKADNRTSATVITTSSVPATVEALALQSALNNMADDDDNDQGLQYYYPDPYHSLAQFSKPVSSKGQEISPSVNAVIEKTLSTSPPRHPLSTAYSDDGLKSRRGVTNVNGPLETNLSRARSSGDLISSVHTIDVASVDGSSKSVSSKSSKGIPKPLKRGSKNDSTAISPVSEHPSSQAGTSPTQPSMLGSRLFRSTSASKKLGGKTKARGSRSKSDVASSRSSNDLAKSSTEPLPAPLIQRYNMFSGPEYTQPLKTSLSPPPRQSWSRSKSFQGSNLAIVSALSNRAFAPGLDASLSSSMHAGNEGEYIPNEPMITSSSSEARSSVSSSSISSPGTDTRSPTLGPFSETGTTSTTSQRTLGSTASPPLLPTKTGYTRTSGPISGRATPQQDSRNYSLDQEQDFRVSLTKDRGTAPMELRKSSNRPQRSIDNLSSAYHFRKAADLGQGGQGADGGRTSPPNSRRGGTGMEMVNNASGPYPPPSPPLVNAGFSYYGVGNGVGVEEASGRNSPSHLQPMLISPSMPGKYTPSYPKGQGISKNSLDYSFTGAGSNSAGQGGSGGRSDSMTSNVYLMEDDPWTQMMVARAQGGNLQQQQRS